MWILWSFVLLLVVLTCAVGPGLVVVRRWRWGPLETLCAAVGLSLVLVYLAAIAVCLSGLPRAGYWAITGAAMLATVACARDLRRLWHDRQVRRVVLATAALAAWAVLLLSLVRHVGGGWYGDWYEHYERSLFFLERWPADVTFLEGRYTLPARPPMMNLLGAHLLAHVGADGGERYALFQIAFLLLNVLAFMPCALAARALVRGGGRRVWLALAVFACNPMFMQNATYSWTRLLCAFYVVLGVWLYLRGWRKRDPGRTVAAVGAMAAATTVHYSAAPYAIALAIHYFAVAARQRGAARVARELAGGAAVAAAVLGPWLAWSALRYGIAGTVGSNTTVSDTAQLTAGENVAKVGRNLVNTLVPHALRGVPQAGFSRGNTFAGYVRDSLFKTYQANLFFAMGSAGALLVPLLALRQLRAAPAALRWFWVWLVAFAVVVGVAAHGTEDEWGLAHIGLQPLVYLGLALLAAGLPTLSAPLKWLALAGLTLDFLHGVLLHFWLQSRPLHLPAGDPDMYARSGLGLMPGLNYGLKLSTGVTFWADHVPAPPAVLVGLAGAGFVLLIVTAARAIRCARVTP